MHAGTSRPDPLSRKGIINAQLPAAFQRIFRVCRPAFSALSGIATHPEGEVPMKSTKRNIALIVATLLALTLQLASTGAMFTPVPIPMPAYTQPVSPHA